VKILVGSYRFPPDIGGIETASTLLAEGFSMAGHDVRVVTETNRDDDEARPFEVIRCPSRSALMEQVRWCQVYFQNNISVHSLWPALIVRRPWVISHQTWIGRAGEKRNWREYVKRLLLRFGRNVSISDAVARELGIRSTVIGNPYRDDVFRLLPEVSRERELVFLGRLVSDKGLDLVIEAMTILGREGIEPRFTVVGNGPEENGIRELARDRGLLDRIEFVGPRTGSELATLLNGHKIMVVPSRWAEPFGIVALEGIACGCVVVGSESGGLRNAIGPCGLTFRNGDVEGLADALRQLLLEPKLAARKLENRESHLAAFRSGYVAGEYLKIFQEVIR